MKNFGMMCIVVLVVLLGAADTFAQKQKYFPSGQACLAALASGNYDYYQPTYFSLHKAAASNERVLGLESDACARMLTVKGYQWVVQKEETKMVFRGQTIIRREDCGNPITDILYPTPPPEVPVVTPTPVPTPQPQPQCPPDTTPTYNNGQLICIEVQQAPPVECPTCPKDISIVPHVSTSQRVFGGLLSTAVSAGLGGGISGIVNKRWEDALRDGAISAGGSRVAQAINPSPDGVKVTASGQSYIFKKGRDGPIGSSGCSLSWDGDMAVVTCGELVCRQLSLTKNFNTTVYTSRRINPRVIIPIKSQPTGSVPTRPRIPSLFTDNGTKAGNNLVPSRSSTTTSTKSGPTVVVRRT